jgi:hypothetical protein
MCIFDANDKRCRFLAVRLLCVCCVFARACACVLMHSRKQPKLVVSHNVGFCCLSVLHKLPCFAQEGCFCSPPVTVPTHPLPI